eukprot:1178502-Prorocentrum_minimum.AAC.3
MKYHRWLDKVLTVNSTVSVSSPRAAASAGPEDPRREARAGGGGQSRLLQSDHGGRRHLAVLAEPAGPGLPEDAVEDAAGEGQDAPAAVGHVQGDDVEEAQGARHAAADGAEGGEEARGFLVGEKGLARERRDRACDLSCSVLSRLMATIKKVVLAFAHVTILTILTNIITHH